MAFQVMRAILKGRLGGVVATRNMFVGEVDLVAPDEYSDVWTQYVGTILDRVAEVTGSCWQTETLELQTRNINDWITTEELTIDKPGEAAGECLANLVAGILIGKGNGKRLMGRKFFSGLAESAVNGNSFVAGAIASMTAAAVAYIAPLTTVNGSVLQPGILDKTGTFKMFSSGWVSALLGTCRRRKPGRGT